MLHEYDEWDTPLAFHPIIEALFHTMTAKVPYENIRVGLRILYLDPQNEPPQGELLHLQSAAHQNATYPPCRKIFMTYKRRVRSHEEFNKTDHLVPTIETEVDGENTGDAVSVRQYIQSLIKMNEEANVGNRQYERFGLEDLWGGWAKQWVDEDGSLHLKGQIWSPYF